MISEIYLRWQCLSGVSSSLNIYLFLFSVWTACQLVISSFVLSHIVFVNGCYYTKQWYCAIWFFWRRILGQIIWCTRRRTVYTCALHLKMSAQVVYLIGSCACRALNLICLLCCRVCVQIMMIRLFIAGDMLKFLFYGVDLTYCAMNFTASSCMLWNLMDLGDKTVIDAVWDLGADCMAEKIEAVIRHILVENYVLRVGSKCVFEYRYSVAFSCDCCTL